MERNSGSPSFNSPGSDVTSHSELDIESGPAWVGEWVSAVMAKKIALHHHDDRCVAGAIIEHSQGPTLCIAIHNLTTGGKINSMFTMRNGTHEVPDEIRRYLEGATLNAERNW